tara:strand:- start:1156 stop:1455 length:300 start_codon:yes stop_codon:yes gene_type:complete
MIGGMNQNTITETNFKPSVQIEGTTVNVYFDEAGVDRPHTYGIQCATRTQVARLKKAIQAGAVFYDFTIAEDVNGKTFVRKSCKVMGRYLNEDLRALGY